MAPQRVAGAVTVSPYTYDARQERGLPLVQAQSQSQVASTTSVIASAATTSTNVATEITDRGTTTSHGKGKKSKAKPRAERPPRQEEEIRFNTGPRNLRAPQVNRGGGRRGFRMPGRSYAEDQNGIPDYPPPSFQEAMTTPPVSVCSSTTSLPLAPALPLAIPENIPEDPRESMDNPAALRSVNEQLHATDDDLDFEGTMFVIDRNSVPVCSTDLPRGAALEERVKSDWLKRRGVEFPGKSSSVDMSLSSSRLGDGIDGSGRGRSTTRLRLTPLLIDPEPKSDDAGLPTPTSAKRRFLSLSPLKTIFPPRSPTQQDRATLSAHPSPSPSSSPYPTSRSLFFRSSSSLATASFLRLPLLSSPIIGKSELLSRKFFKGKDRGKRGTQDSERFDAWEILEEDAFAGFDEDGKESTGHPRSLLSAVESIQPYSNGNTSPTRSHSFTYGKQISDESRMRRPLVVPEAIDEERRALGLTQAGQETSMRDWKGPSLAFIDRPLHRSRSPIPGVETPSSPSIPHRNPITSASDYTPPLHAGPSLVSVRVRAPSPSPPPSLALKRTAHVPSPLRLGAKPNVIVEDQSAAEAAMYQRALETPLPMTPVFHNHFDHGGSVGVAVNDEDDLDLPPSMPPSARTLPSSLTNSVSAHDLTATAPGFATSVPATLSIATHPSATMSTPTQVVKTNSLEEPMTPTRHHYAGRPLPRPPPSLSTNTSRVAVVDSMYASSETPIQGGDKNGSSYNTCPEGLLIDLEDTTLDPLPASGSSTPSSARFRSQAHLPLSQASTSSVDLLAEPPSRNLDSPGPPRHPPAPQQSSALLELTDLDLLVSQLADEDPNGTDYEKLLLLSEVLGPASTTMTTPNPNLSNPTQVGSSSSSSTSQKSDPPETNGNISLVGRIDVKRRRTTKEGIVKLKLTLLDVAVNKCGICLFQFKEGDVGALTSACQHSFHESCLGRWHARSKTCPLCRVPLDTDVR